MFMALNDLSGVRHAYEVGREIRGLSVRQEAMDMIFTPNAMYTSLGIMLSFYILVAYLLIKNKAYFCGNDLSA